VPTETSSRFLPSVKNVTSSQGLELEALKKQSIAAQMRAKHLGLYQSATNVTSSGVDAQNTSASTFPLPTTLPISSIALHKISSTNSGKSQESPAPENNYEISDKEDSDDDDESDSDSSDANKKKKRVPLWAQKDQLLPELERQFSHKHAVYVDPDELFGEVESCNLKDIFGSPRKGKYQNRTSTGNWTQDRVTAAEKLAYKRDHKMRIMNQC
jgi:Inner centromere protein, ARK binding region